MALEFSPEALKKFEETVARYPKKEAAMLPVLYLAQQEFGYIGSEAVEYVAKLMGQAPARVQGVVTFYTMSSLWNFLKTQGCLWNYTLYRYV